MTDNAIDRALAVFRAYAKTGVTGVTENSRVMSEACSSVTPVTRVTPQKPIPQTNQNPGSFPYAGALSELERGCPNYVEHNRWQQCIRDAERFLADWGPQAEALEWSSGDLFGLHTPLTHPHPAYSRLSRYDATGLLWGLEGRRVVALSSNTAAIVCDSGSILKYRKLNK